MAFCLEANVRLKAYVHALFRAAICTHRVFRCVRQRREHAWIPLLSRNLPMRLGPDVEFQEDIRLLVWKPRGLLNEASFNKVILVLGDLEASMREPFNRFSDTLEAEEVDLNFRYVIHVSLYRRLTYTGHPPVKSAILATDSAMIHYARLHAVLTQGSPINVRIFQEREKAAQWLALPLERLAIQPAANES